MNMDMTCNSPNFNGRYIKSVNVLKNNVPTKVSLIELSKKDLYNIERVHEQWDTTISYLIAKSIYFPAKDTISQNIYAVSTQTKDFEKLAPSKVLGMFEVTDRGEHYLLDYLDVKPKHKYDKNKSVRKGFSQVGRACIDYIKSRFKNKDVEIHAVDNAIPFYEKVGCEKSKEKSVLNRFIIPKHD